jgi:hypothetical protein
MYAVVTRPTQRRQIRQRILVYIIGIPLDMMDVKRRHPAVCRVTTPAVPTSMPVTVQHFRSLRWRNRVVPALTADIVFIILSGFAGSWFCIARFWVRIRRRIRL